MAERADKQPKKQLDWLKQYQWQKGQSGNPKGRPKGKTLKEWVKDFLMNMSDEARVDFIKMVDPDIIWKMAEGNPHQTGDITTAGKPIPILNLNEKNEIHKDNGDNQDTETSEKD